LTIITLLSCYACHHSGTSTGTDAKSMAYIDSLRCGDHYIYLEPIDRDDYMKLSVPVAEWFDPWELPDYGKGKPEDTTQVYYRDTIYQYDGGQVDSSAKVLTLATQKGAAVRLISYFTDHYYFVKQIKELNSYLVVFADPGMMKYYLIDRVTGQKAELKGYPVISPDGKTICCVPRECNGLAACTSFFIYSFADGNATLQCEKADSFIGRPDIKWSDSHTLYMKIAQITENTEGKQAPKHTWYAKLSIPEFKK